MRKLAIAAAVSMSLATFSANTLALGLGEIEMYSALNQSLDAEINILSAAPGELEGLMVRLASPSAYARAGLHQQPILSSMVFEVEERPGRNPVVKISSTAPVVEPFLNFLLEVESGQGDSLIREYTVLLDPPVYTATQSAPAAKVADSEVIDLDKELGASIPIDRSIPSELVISDAEEGGDIIDLSNEIAVAGNSAGLLDLSGAQSEIVNLDNISDGTPSQPDAVVVVEQDVITRQGLGDGLLQPEVYIEQISLDSQPNATPLVEIDTFAETGSVASGDDGGVAVSLEDLGASGDPIFGVKTDALGNQVEQISAGSDEKFIVDLSGVALESVNAGEDGLEELVGGVEVSLDELMPRAVFDSNQLPAADADSQAQSEYENVELIAQSDASSVDVQSLEFGEEIDLSGELPELAAQGSNAAAASSFVAAVDDSAGSVLVDLEQSSGIGSGDLSQYIVGKYDTLWSIAQRMKPAGVSTQQMMVALLRENDSAFVDGDMNQMRNGAVLNMPSDEMIAELGTSEALAMVREQVVHREAVSGDDTVIEETRKPLSIVGVDEDASSTGTPATDESSSGADLTRNLEEVNRRMQLAQEELASESMQRDELRGRVNELESSMTKMKRLITLRESELSNLQDELTSAKTDTTEAAAEAEDKARKLALAQSEKDAMQERLKALQDKITTDASIAQNRVDEQADADKNLASAEAAARSVRLASEEDTIRTQLAALQIEKKLLEETSQNDRMELVRQAEAEKADLLAQAKAERERIKAELEAEKSRISSEALAERERIAAEAQADKERLIAEAETERARLAAESETMRVKLVELEEEKTRLLAEAEADKARLLAEAEADKTQLQKAADDARQRAAEQERLQAEAQAEKMRVEEESSRVKDRLAQLQAEASANLASSTETPEAEIIIAKADNDPTGALPAVTGTKTDVSAEVGSMATDLAGKGVAAASGLLAIAPLQDEVGDRKKVLATGGGIALLGLLGAWAMRRRNGVVKEDIDLDDNDSGLAAGRSSVAAPPANISNEEPPQATSATRTVAAAAAGGAAAVARKAASNDPVGAGRHEEQLDSPVVRTVLSDAEPLEDGMLLDDTITEAEVYLRYGLHGQAEDLLQTAIERSPDHEGYHLKLLENYHDQKNEQAFKVAAATFQDRFGNSANWPAIAEMGRDFDSSDESFSRVTAMDAAGGVAAGVVGAGGVGAALDSINDRVGDTADNLSDATNATSEVLDDTFDPGSEFSVSELEATGEFGNVVDDLDDVTLDEVDLAALDDDGTLNLEELAGDEMSGLDLGVLDLTNPDSDSTLNNLTLDDADLNSLGDITSSVRSGLESDLSVDDLDGGLNNSNEMETMLDLAKAYIDMGDNDSAAGALRDIAENGNPAQQAEASELLRKLN